MKLFYSDDYVRAAHSFDTVRKAQWIANSLESDRIPGVELVVPAPATQRHLEAIHDPEYVAAVRTGHPLDRAESQGFAWDPGMWNAVCASTGGTVAAALAALQDGVSGSLSSGLHHARRDGGTASLIRASTVSAKPMWRSARSTGTHLLSAVANW